MTKQYVNIAGIRTEVSSANDAKNKLRAAGINVRTTEQRIKRAEETGSGDTIRPTNLRAYNPKPIKPKNAKPKPIDYSNTIHVSRSTIKPDSSTGNLATRSTPIKSSRIIAGRESDAFMTKPKSKIVRPRNNPTRASIESVNVGPYAPRWLVVDNGTYRHESNPDLSLIARQIDGYRLAFIPSREPKPKPNHSAKLASVIRSFNNRKCGINALVLAFLSLGIGSAKAQAQAEMVRIERDSK